MEKTEISRQLDQLEPGTKISIKLADGTTVAGAFSGVDGDQVHLEGAGDVAVEDVENVLMDVATDGPE